MYKDSLEKHELGSQLLQYFLKENMIRKKKKMSFFCDWQKKKSLKEIQRHWTFTSTVSVHFVWCQNDWTDLIC